MLTFSAFVRILIGCQMSFGTNGSGSSFSLVRLCIVGRFGHGCHMSFETMRILLYPVSSVLGNGRVFLSLLFSRRQ